MTVSGGHSVRKFYEVFLHISQDKILLSKLQNDNIIYNELFSFSIWLSSLIL